MNKKKNGVSLGAILLLIIIIVIIVFAIKSIHKNGNQDNNGNSEKIANFRISNIKCTKGQEITVEIELLNNSNFVAGNFEYKYDSTCLEYLNYEIGDSIKDGAMTIVNNDKANNKVLIGFVAKPESEKIIKAGKIIDIKFKVKEALTKNKIENVFECTTLKEEDGTDIKYKVQQGIIEIN